jgi:leucyl aminopeptidase
MRRVLVVAMLVMACSSERRPSQVYVTVGTDAVASVRALAAKQGAPLQQFAAGDQVAVVAVEDDEIDALAHLMHEEFRRCGGFMVHDSLDDALAALNPAPMRGPIEYTLDRAAVVKTVLPVLDRDRIRTTIGELSAMKNRYYRSETGAAASTWLRDRWRSFTKRRDVTIELFDQGYPQKSVIMTIPGTTRADEVIVIGGHLDSISLGGKAGRAPGADDDASGVATMTEVARALLATDYQPARTIKFIAYAAEEVGLRGSQAVVKEFKKRGINVIGALQLDMTNYQGSEKDIWLMKDFTSAAQNTFLTTLIDTYVGATWGLDACGYACSDHASWYRAGVPASMPFESRMRDRNMQIHTANDTLERSKDNADHAIKFARLAAAYAIELGKGELGSVVRTASR